LEIEKLEKEKVEVENQINSGLIIHSELIAKSNRIGQIISLLDSKSERWLELMDIDENAG
jgi:ATP-binding cassette subfamily F protein uup